MPGTPWAMQISVQISRMEGSLLGWEGRTLGFPLKDPRAEQAEERWWEGSPVGRTAKMQKPR